MKILDKLKRSKPMGWARAAMLAGAIWLGGCSDDSAHNVEVSVVQPEKEKLRCEIPEGVLICPEVEGGAQVDRARTIFGIMANQACDVETGKPKVKGTVAYSADCAVRGVYNSNPTPETIGQLDCLRPVASRRISTTRFCADVEEHWGNLNTFLAQCLSLGPDELHVSSSLNAKTWACGLGEAEIGEGWVPEAASLIPASGLGSDEDFEVTSIYETGDLNVGEHEEELAGDDRDGGFSHTFGGGRDVVGTVDTGSQRALTEQVGTAVDIGISSKPDVPADSE